MRSHAYDDSVYKKLTVKELSDYTGTNPVRKASVLTDLLSGHSCCLEMLICIDFILSRRYGTLKQETSSNDYILSKMLPGTHV